MKILAFCLNRADDIFSADYKGFVNSVLDLIETVFAVLMIAADIVAMVWVNGGKSAVVRLHLWWDDSFIPAVENAVVTVYLAGGYIRVVWERVNSPLFIVL